MVSRKRKFRIIVIGLLVLLLLGLLSGLLAYRLRPLHYQQTICACTLDGEVMELTLDISLYRHLWKPMEYHGKIMIDGVEYVSAYDLYPEMPPKSDKTFLFYIPSSSVLDIGDYIWITPIDNYFDCFWFGISEEGATDGYFAPAASQEEAGVIAEKVLNPQK